MNRIKTMYFLVIVLSLPPAALAWQNPELPVPLDPEVRAGVLDNGLTYYIRHNQEPAERASFYLVQNAGALLEEDDQNGLAHFLEHMAFNGTVNFEGKGILNALERHGVAFGRNINAYTSFNETVYNISDVPVNKAGIIDTCLLILHDWSSQLLLAEEEIDRERGVITEEWRTRRTSGIRIQDQWFPVLFKGSRYAVRDIIGDTAVIRNHTPETLHRFYHDWYRPDLQAIIVVGDFDVDEIEKRVISLFSTIAPVENPRERPFFNIPLHEETYFIVATDPEASQSRITLHMLSENNDMEEKTLGDLRNNYIRSLYNSMSGMRFQELVQKGEPPFINGYSGISGFVRGYDNYQVHATANPGSQAAALEAALIETERIRRHGFTGSELERAKANFLSNLESRFRQRDKISNDAYARQLQGHYLVRSAVPGIEFEYEYASRIVPLITVEEVSRLADKWIRPDNRTLVITGPPEEEMHLTQEEAFAIIEKVENMEITPYEDELADVPLIDDELTGSPVISTKRLEEFDAVEWTLANNVKVVYRHADYQKDNVSLLAYSPGGGSLWDDEFVPSLGMINEFISSYGAGDFDALSLQKMLSGKRVSLNPFIGENSEGFNGASAPRDFETMMQLVWLYFENPRFDRGAHDALMARYRSFVSNLQNEPAKIMSDSLSRILGNYHPRIRLMDAKYLEDVDMDHIREIYLDRMYNAGDFIFFIVGNIGEEAVRSLSEKYLGSLSSSSRTETWKDHGIRVPGGVTERRIELPLATPKAGINLYFVNNVPYNAYNNMAMRIIRGILNLRYIETVREEEGGTYGVSVRWSLSRIPVEEGRFIISFDTDPEKADHLKSIIFREIDSIIENGPSRDDFDKTVQNLLKDREQARRNNNFWMNSLYNYYVTGINNADRSNYEELLLTITPEDIRDFIKEYFTGVNTIDVMFLPGRDS
jgi:zinc protease